MGMINKRTADIERPKIPVPEQTYDTPKTTMEEEIKEAKKINKAKPKSSSIRIDKLYQLKLSTLVALDKCDTVNDLIIELVDDYIFTKLNKQERESFEMMMMVYKNKFGLK